MKSSFLAAAAASMLALSVPAHAQQAVEWTQVLNLPKGYNMPKGMKAEILGLELGDTYDEAKAKLEKLQAEGIQPARPAQEARLGFTLPVGSAPPIRASYIGQIVLTRKTEGAGPRQVSDEVQIHFNAPASGHQAYKIARSINYWEQANQPRISEMVAALKSKFGTNARFVQEPKAARLYFQYDNGAPVITNESFNATCTPGVPTNSNEIRTINSNGKCDVYLRVTFATGISPDHASEIYFEMADLQRARENLTADYKFFDDYTRKVQQQTRGAPTKL